MTDAPEKRALVRPQMPRGRRFGEGQPANAGGRPKALKDVVEACRAMTPQALKRLEYWMNADDSRASMAATLAIVERAWGKPVQPLSGPDGEGPMRLVIGWERGE